MFDGQSFSSGAGDTASQSGGGHEVVFGTYTARFNRWDVDVVMDNEAVGDGPLADGVQCGQESRLERERMNLELGINVPIVILLKNPDSLSHRRFL